MLARPYYIPAKFNLHPISITHNYGQRFALATMWSQDYTEK